MAHDKKKKKGGVRWVGPAKLVAEVQDATATGGGYNDMPPVTGNPMSMAGPGSLGSAGGYKKKPTPLKGKPGKRGKK